jgi:hypothetical protein
MDRETRSRRLQRGYVRSAAELAAAEVAVVAAKSDEAIVVSIMNE